MEDFSVLVAGLEYKVRQLIEQKNSYKSKFDEMKGLIEFLEKENSSLKEQIENISKEREILKISGSIDESKNSKEVKLLINNYIREIDKCIAYFYSN